MSLNNSSKSDPRKREIIAGGASSAPSLKSLEVDDALTLKRLWYLSVASIIAAVNNKNTLLL